VTIMKHANDVANATYPIKLVQTRARTRSYIAAWDLNFELSRLLYRGARHPLPYRPDTQAYLRCVLSTFGSVTGVPWVGKVTMMPVATMRQTDSMVL